MAPPQEWTTFLAAWRKSHPKVTGKEVMKQAAVDYRKRKTTKK